MKPKFEQNFIVCSCGDVSHQLIISIFDYTTSLGKNQADCFLQIHLNKLSFFERIKVAFKYIFGFQCKYGAFNEVIIDKTNAEKIKNCMEMYLTKIK